MNDKKPNRKPSKMSMVISMIMAAMGVVWTLMALQAQPSTAIFGILWTVIIIGNTIYMYKHGTPSTGFSLTNLTGGGSSHREAKKEQEGSRYCPYCGAEAEENYEFCNRCGKKLP